MYLLAIAICVLLVFGFWLFAYLGFRGFQKFCPRLFRRVEGRLEPRLRRTLNPEDREFFGICPPDQIEKLLGKDFNDLPPAPPSKMKAGEHWIDFGLKLENPRLFIRWDINRKQLVKLLKAHGGIISEDKEINVFGLDAVLSPEIKAMVFFDFHKFVTDQLYSVNIQLPHCSPVAESFETNDRRLREIFGTPQPSEKFGLTQWDFPRTKIQHELSYPPYANDPEQQIELTAIRRKTKSEIRANAIANSSQSV
jgi:hypothetical protein